jgi:hypothetical protein
MWNYWHSAPRAADNADNYLVRMMKLATAGTQVWEEREVPAKKKQECWAVGAIVYWHEIDDMNGGQKWKD